MSMLWHGLTAMAAPLLPWWLQRRAARGKEDLARLHERYGQGATRPEGILLWLHGASVGEGLSLIPLMEALALRLPQAHFLLTTGTVTSAELVMERLPPALRDRVQHRYAPLDVRPWLTRFLAGWRPDAAIFAESELWPNRLLATRQMRVPMALVNARMSVASAERWRRWAPGMARRMLRSFTLIQPQSLGDAARLHALGDLKLAPRGTLNLGTQNAGTLRPGPLNKDTLNKDTLNSGTLNPSALTMLPAGDLKASAPPLPFDAAALARLRGPGPVFLAASTHPGEEAIILAAHALLRENHPGLRTIIVPRHPNRGAEIAALTGGTRRSLGQEPGEIHIADTLGELGLFYRLADVALVGGSLVPHGGQNPMEPARLGCPILLGPHTGNFQDRVEDLLAAQAANRVDPPNATTLAAAIDHVLTHEPDAKRMTEAARLVAERTTGTADRLADEVVQWLIRSPDAAAAETEQEHQNP